MLFLVKESPRFHLMKNNFDEAFDIIDNLRVENQFPKMSENIKSSLKVYYIHKKSLSIDSLYSSTLRPKYANLTINIWIMWFVVSYVFYGVLYLIPEIVGKKDKSNINFSELISAVVYSTFFEIIGILSTLIIDSEKFGRLGSFRLSFILSFIFSTLCIFQFKGWIICLHILKGAIQISSRALYIYTSECYPTEIRGIALGLANVFTRIAGLLTPICNELLLTISPTMCFIGLSFASFFGIIISYIVKHETLNKKLD